MFAGESKKSMFCFSTVQAKLAAVESTHGEGQTQLNQQIQKLQGENVLLQDDKEKVTRKMEELGSQLQQGWFYKLLK